MGLVKGEVSVRREGSVSEGRSMKKFQKIMEKKANLLGENARLALVFFGLFYRTFTKHF